MTTFALKYDHDIIIIESTKSLKLFWCTEVARRWIEIKICYGKSFPSFPMHTQKRFSCFSLQLCSIANSKSIASKFNDSLDNLASKSIYFSWDFCVLFTLTSSFASDWKKVQLVEPFFQSCKWNKNTWFMQQLILGMLRDLILQ